MNSLEESISQAAGCGGEVEVPLARLYLKGHAASPIPLVEQDALLDDPAPDHQWGLIDGTHIHRRKPYRFLNRPLNGKFQHKAVIRGEGFPQHQGDVHVAKWSHCTSRHRAIDVGCLYGVSSQNGGERPSQPG